MAEGEFAPMKHNLEEALKKDILMGITRGGDNEFYAMLVDAAAQQRDLAALQKYAPLAEESATSIGHNLHIAIAYRAWGVAHTLAGEYPQAEARLLQALEIFNNYPAPWQIGRTLFELGGLARAQLKIDQAQAHFSRALSIFEELRAAPYATQSRTALEALSQA